MNKSSPQTITNNLIEKISSYNLDNLPSEFELKSLLRDADKLKKVSPAEGWMLLGMIHSLSDYSEESIYAFENALALSTNQFNLVLKNYIGSLEYLGKFEDICDLLKKYISDDNHDLISSAITIFARYGLIDDALSYQRKLKKLNIKIPLEAQLNYLVALCSQLNIDYSHLHEIYLFALSSMHKAGVMPNKMEFMEADDALIIIFYVNTSAENMSNIEWSIVDKLAESNTSPAILKKIVPILKSQS